MRSSFDRMVLSRSFILAMGPKQRSLASSLFLRPFIREFEVRRDFFRPCDLLRPAVREASCVEPHIYDFFLRFAHAQMPW